MILVNKPSINKNKGRNFESSESSENVEEGDDDGNTTTVRLKNSSNLSALRQNLERGHK